MVTAVRVLDRGTGGIRELAPQDCGFGYRDSRFKHDPAFVVLAVELTLADERARRSGTPSWPARSGSRSARPPRRRTCGRRSWRLRRRKGMVLDPADPDTRSAGSFFTNPVLGRTATRRLAALPGDGPAVPGRAGLGEGVGGLADRAGRLRARATGTATPASRPSTRWP